MTTGADVLQASLVVLQNVRSSLATSGDRMSAEEVSKATERLQGIEKRVQVLSQKITLRAKGSSNTAYPLSEAVGRLTESHRDLRDVQIGSHLDALADFQDDLETLEREVNVLEETIRSRTLVLT